MKASITLVPVGARFGQVYLKVPVKRSPRLTNEFTVRTSGLNRFFGGCDQLVGVESLGSTTVVDREHGCSTPHSPRWLLHEHGWNRRT
jgi:hypothetical protein